MATVVSAVEMGARQREISVSEFFTKNRHLLGFDNPRKALLTCVKEAVDNALDASEEAGILPDVVVTLEVVSTNGAAPSASQAIRFRVTITDNGPGIVRQQIPPIFAKLLYGSKFHRLRMSRGQQGIGISAAGMYAQLTTGKPVQITSRTGARAAAHYFEVQIDTKKNEPSRTPTASSSGSSSACSTTRVATRSRGFSPAISAESPPRSPRRSARRRSSRRMRGRGTFTARTPRPCTRPSRRPESWRRRRTASRPSARRRCSTVCTSRSRANSTRR
jgi:DNA topoisomerase VI subunit B